MKQHEAFELYLAGKTEVEIARAIGKSRATIQRWKHKEKWEEKKEVQLAQLEHIAFQARVQAQREAFSNAHVAIVGMMRIVAEIARHYEATGTILEKYSNLKEFIGINYNAVKTLRVLFPMVDKELIERLLTELAPQEDSL